MRIPVKRVRCLSQAFSEDRPGERVSEEEAISHDF
jgi:hypothetical protein